MLEKELHSKDIIFIKGLRRVGKTSLMFSMISILLRQVAPERILYVSLDTVAFEAYNILDIIEEYRKIHKLGNTEKVFLFLDEVATKKEYEIQLKNLYDIYNVKIYASSSNHSLNSSKNGYIVGRTRNIEINPLSFPEFLQFKGITIEKSDAHLYESYFEDYMRIGGIPEFVLRNNLGYMNDLIELILTKDIVSSNGIKEPQIIRDMFKLLCERVGKPITLNRISNILDISFDSVRRYMGFFEDSYLFYLVDRCGKLNERIKSPKKIYIADVGIRNIAVGFRDKGSVFENLVFLQLKDKNPCYILKDGHDLDFSTESGIFEAKLGGLENEGQAELIKKESKGKKVQIIKDYRFFL